MGTSASTPHDLKVLRLGKQPQTPAAKAREHRQRVHDGVWRCVYVPIPWRVLLAMIERGLSENNSRDPKAVGLEAKGVLEQWADAWFAATKK